MWGRGGCGFDIDTVSVREEGNFLTLIFEVSKNKQTPSSSSGVLDFVGCTRLAVTVSPH